MKWILIAALAQTADGDWMRTTSWKLCELKLNEEKNKKKMLSGSILMKIFYTMIIQATR